MLTAPGFVTVFVDGFGVDVPEAQVKGTLVKPGDMICKRTLEWLRTRPLTDSAADASVNK